MSLGQGFVLGLIIGSGIITGMGMALVACLGLLMTIGG